MIGNPRVLLTTACLLLLTTLVACGGGSSNTHDSAAPIGSVSTTSLASVHTAATYPLEIYLPPSYARGTGTYPVIYATDGDATYPPSGRFANFKEVLQRRGMEAILVGIGGTARRTTDFVLPGAENYHKFITTELVPFIEAKYRADPSRRILSGLSLGGSFVMSSLLFDAPALPTFSHYLSTEGSFQQQSFLAQESQASSQLGNKSVPATLILAAGSPNGSTNAQVVEALYQRLVVRSYVGLRLLRTSFATDHVGTDIPAFEDAISRLSQ